MRNQLGSIYFQLIKALFSQYKGYVKPPIESNIRPMMKYKEVKIIRNVLETLKPKKCLEWGAGFSSLYFPNYLENGSKWFSIEHDLTWFNKIKILNQNPKCAIFHVNPNHFPWTDEFNDGGFSDLRDYLTFPRKFGKFDFILIDGRARNYCLIAALELIEYKGIVVLHDANRGYYKYSNLFKYELVFKDSRKDAGGVMLGSQGFPLRKITDIEMDYQLWYWIDNFAKIAALLENVLPPKPA